MHGVYVKLSLKGSNLKGQSNKAKLMVSFTTLAAELSLHTSCKFTITTPTATFPSFSGPLLHEQKKQTKQAQ